MGTVVAPGTVVVTCGIAVLEGWQVDDGPPIDGMVVVTFFTTVEAGLPPPADSVLTVGTIVVAILRGTVVVMAAFF